MLGAVFKQLGTSPLISQPVKGPYSRHDLALYRGYFIDNRNLGETKIEVETAASLGIDKEAVTAALHDGGVKVQLRSAVEGR